jgi:hypothetical protein
MRLFVCVVAAAIACLGMGSQVAAEPVKPVAFPQEHSEFKADPQTRYGRLPNGMTYILRHNATPPGETDVYLRVAAGSMEETPRQRGLAHFLEHMAFEGSKNVPNGELQKILQRHGFAFGADINANTFTGDTVYKLTAPKSDADSLDTTLFPAARGRREPDPVPGRCRSRARRHPVRTARARHARPARPAQGAPDRRAGPAVGRPAECRRLARDRRRGLGR